MVGACLGLGGLMGKRDWYLDSCFMYSEGLASHFMTQYVGPVTDNPYDNPDLPPDDDNPDGVCCMKWSEDQLSESGARKYWLR